MARAGVKRCAGAAVRPQTAEPIEKLPGAGAAIGGREERRIGLGRGGGVRHGSERRGRFLAPGQRPLMAGPRSSAVPYRRSSAATAIRARSPAQGRA